MNRSLALLIQTHGQQIWPFLAILARYVLEAGNKQDFIDCRTGEVDENFLRDAQDSGLLRYERSGSALRIYLRREDFFMYSGNPQPAEQPLRQNPSLVKRGSKARFEGLSIREVVGAVDPLAENYQHLRFQLDRLRRDFPDSQILKVAEHNRNKLSINQFLTTKVFRRLIQEYEKEKGAFSHRGTQEYSEWQ